MTGQSYGATDTSPHHSSIAANSDSTAGVIGDRSRFSKACSSACGPLLIVALASCIIYLCLQVLFVDVHDPFGSRIKLSGCCFGVAAAVAGVLCYLVDPGTPARDPDDPGPIDDSEEEGRSRQRMLSDGRSWTQKWCRQCHVWRPYRCGHCRFCGRCILRLDHHCHVVGTCIGEGNLLLFVALIVCTSIALLHVVVMTVHCIKTHQWVLDDLPWYRLLLICDLICGGGTCGVLLGVLGCYYLCLVLFDSDPRHWDSSAVLDKSKSFSGVQVLCCAPLTLKQSWHEDCVEKPARKVSATASA